MRTALVESRAGEMSMAEVMIRMNRVIEAVRASVPPSCGRRSTASSNDDAEPLEEEDWDGFEPDEDPFEPDDDFDGPDE